MDIATKNRFAPLTPAQQREINEAKGKLITIIGQVEASNGRTARISTELDRLITDLEMWQTRHASNEEA